jgi:hypothetical protein
MREVTSVDENDLPGKPFSFALCTPARKFWFQVCDMRTYTSHPAPHTFPLPSDTHALECVGLQAASVEEKVAWTQTFSAFVLENLSTSLEKVELTSDLRTQGPLRVACVRTQSSMEATATTESGECVCVCVCWAQTCCT